MPVGRLLLVGQVCPLMASKRCRPLHVYSYLLLCAVCWRVSGLLVSALVLPRVMWDAWPLPGDFGASVGWGKGAMRGQQFTVPRHEKTDPQPIFLPIGSQLMENGAILAVGYNNCQGPKKFEAYNRAEREASKAEHGNMAAVGGGWISKECIFALTQFETTTGKHLRTFEYPTDQDADPVVVGFYAHDSTDLRSPKMSNALVMFVWQQQVTHKQRICTADAKTRFFFNGLTTDTVKALQRGRAYRAFFKEKDETVLRDPYGTAAHIPPIGARLCDAYYTDKVKPEAADLKNAFPNDHTELAPAFLDCGSTAKADKNLLPPGKGRNCLNIPFDSEEPLGMLWGRAVKVDDSKPGSYPYKEWREAPTTTYPVKKIPLLRSNFKNVVAVYEGNFSRPKHYAYFLLHYNYVSSPAGPPNRACFAAAMSHELRIQYIYFGCQRCGEFGVLPWMHSASLGKPEKLFGLLTWCVEEGHHLGDHGTVLQTPSLILNGATSERRVVLSDLVSDAGYPASIVLKGSYFLPWIRNVHVIPLLGSTRVYYFYVVEKYIPISDFRFGPVAAAEVRWGTIEVGDNKAAVVPSASMPVFNEVFSPEIQAFSVVPVGGNVLMLAYENAIQQTFQVVLFDPAEEGVLEGADLLFPDSQSEAYNSFVYGTETLHISGGEGDARKWHEGLKLQFGRPGKADTVTDFPAPKTILADSFSSGDMFRIRFAAEELYCEGKWEPALRFAPCTFHCNQVQTFHILDGAPSSTQCPWKDGQHRVIPCDTSPCSFVEFDVEREPALLGSVDRDIRTSGASFAPGSLSPVTFKLKTVSDIWEVTLLFKGAPEQKHFPIELFFLDGQGQEFTKREVTAGGEFSVRFPFRRDWGLLPGASNAGRAGGEQSGHVGYVVRATFMQLYGVHSIGIVYHGKENPAELLEVLVKGRPEPAVCPPHGFFANPEECPPKKELFIPEKLTDLDCQGFWSEWSVCDHFCRQMRFFQKSRDPYLGGMPCPTVQYNPCDEGPFCKAGETRYSALLDNFKRRDCQYEVGDWSECVNCRQLRYLHVLAAPAKDGVACPTTPPVIQTRFCDRACEKIFAEGGSAKPEPPPLVTTSTTTSTSSTTSSSSSTSSSTTVPSNHPSVDHLRRYLVLAIVGGNLLLLLLFCCGGLYILRARSLAFERMLEGRKREIELKKVICRQQLRAKRNNVGRAVNFSEKAEGAKIGAEPTVAISAQHVHDRTDSGDMTQAPHHAGSVADTAAETSPVALPPLRGKRNSLAQSPADEISSGESRIATHGPQSAHARARERKKKRKPRNVCESTAETQNTSLQMHPP